MRLPPPSELRAGAVELRPATGRIAVFTNCYPKLSHSFIRNEIQALERLGWEVLRITIRHSPEGLIDEADRLEAAQTHALLSGGMWPLIRSVAARCRTSPRRFLSALRLALSEPQRIAGRFRNIAYFIEACRLAEMLEVAGIGHVHAHFGTNPAAIARLASRLGHIGYSMTVHGPDEFDAPVPLHLPAKIADARLVVAVSDFGRSQLLRWCHPRDWSKVAVVRCGVADSFHMPGDTAGPATRTLVCVARLSTQKGIPLLLEASALLARTDAFDLRIIGDGELRGDLETAIAARGLERHVTLVGWLGPDGVRRELLGARALVLPSFAEGLPVVLMEALALGRPVIATAVAGIPELVDADTGWLVRAGSASALADAMRAALAAEPATLAAMAETGRRRVRRDHDVNRNAAQLTSLLRAVGA